MDETCIIPAPSFVLLTMMGPMNTHNLLNWLHRNQNLEPVCKFTYKMINSHHYFVGDFIAFIYLLH